MTHPTQHKVILKKAYPVLKNNLENEFFPALNKIQKYESKLGPDTFHVGRFLGFYKKFNHMNSPDFKGALNKINPYYMKLVKNLKKHKGAKTAAWLAHFCVDALEPTHLEDWRYVKNKKRMKEKHIWVEINTKHLPIEKTLSIIQIRSIHKYIEEASNQIRKLKILDLYPNNKTKIFKLYKQKVLPIQVQAVASVWNRAICDAHEI
ncbi:MAG: hypothetical protein MAG795_00219 [Candidatus Woesearchaeota archaeon]|nr:hypothetical protein [Candidatus Woesearchaeota archaeon]